MLKKETLIQNAVLANLTEEQIKAIETLSENDENFVIGKRLGEFHRKYEDSIKLATGVEKQGDEKSYDYLKRAAEILKSKAEKSSSYEAKIAELTSEKARLEKLVQEGGSDVELKNSLKNVQSELTETKRLYTELQGTLQQKEQEYSQKLHGVEVDFEIGKAASSLKFKPEISEAAAKVLLSQAKEALKRNKTEFQQDQAGEKRLIFKKEDGTPLINQSNGLNPFTAAELLHQELSKYGVLAEAQPRAGGGTNPPGKQGMGQAETFEVSSAKSKSEFTSIVSKHLLSKGHVKGTNEFDKAQAEIIAQNKDIYEALPLK